MTLELFRFQIFGLMTLTLYLKYLRTFQNQDSYGFWPTLFWLVTETIHIVW